MKWATAAVLLLLGCSGASAFPSSLLCGWYPKATYTVGDAAATLRPSAGAAVSWLGADPCDVDARPQCWPAGAKLQLWARADTTGDLDIQRTPCE
jgi:hypothetical protein